MLKFVAPLLVFGIVVFVHELGHFLAAKLSRVYAPVFAFGWGPRLFGFKWGETDYRWSWFPLGGFVAMATRETDGASGPIEGNTSLGEAEASAPDEVPGHQRGWNPIPYDPEALKPFGPRPIPPERWIEAKPLSAKIFILSAGVLMNIVLALVVNIGSLAGFGRGYVPAVVNSLVAGRPAVQAGMLPGDSIVAIDGTPIRRWSDVLRAVSAAPGRPLLVEVARGGPERIALRVTPAPTQEPDPVTGIPSTVGRIGAAPQPVTARERLGTGEAVREGWSATWRMAGGVARVVRGLFVGDVSVRQLGGPIAIARTSFEAAKSGWEDLLALLAFLSVNVAILNLLPIPVLDGGQILLRVVEAVKGGALSDRTQEIIARIGVGAIALLFLLVMYNDVKGLLQPWLP